MIAVRDRDVQVAGLPCRPTRTSSSVARSRASARAPCAARDPARRCPSHDRCTARRNARSPCFRRRFRTPRRTTRREQLAAHVRENRRCRRCACRGSAANGTDDNSPRSPRSTGSRAHVREHAVARDDARQILQISVVPRRRYRAEHRGLGAKLVRVPTDAKPSPFSGSSRSRLCTLWRISECPGSTMQRRQSRSRSEIENEAAHGGLLRNAPRHLAGTAATETSRRTTQAASRIRGRGTGVLT